MGKSRFQCPQLPDATYTVAVASESARRFAYEVHDTVRELARRNRAYASVLDGWFYNDGYEVDVEGDPPQGWLVLSDLAGTANTSSEVFYHWLQIYRADAAEAVASWTGALFAELEGELVEIELRGKGVAADGSYRSFAELTPKQRRIVDRVIASNLCECVVCVRWRLIARAPDDGLSGSALHPHLTQLTSDDLGAHLSRLPPRVRHVVLCAGLTHPKPTIRAACWSWTSIALTRVLAEEAVADEALVGAVIERGAGAVAEGSCTAGAWIDVLRNLACTHPERRHDIVAAAMNTSPVALAKKRPASTSAWQALEDFLAELVIAFPDTLEHVVASVMERFASTEWPVPRHARQRGGGKGVDSARFCAELRKCAERGRRATGNLELAASGGSLDVRSTRGEQLAVLNQHERAVVTMPVGVETIHLVWIPTQWTNAQPIRREFSLMIPPAGVVRIERLQDTVPAITRVLVPLRDEFAWPLPL